MVRVVALLGPIVRVRWRLAVAVAQRAAGTGLPEGGQAEGEPPRISDARAGLAREHAEFGSASVGEPEGEAGDLAGGVGERR